MKKKIEKDLTPMTVENLIAFLLKKVDDGVVSKTSPVIMASDEEGNSYSELTLRGISAGDSMDNDESCVVFYPLFNREYDECFNEGRV
jgi:hypothetical protein